MVAERTTAATMQVATGGTIQVGLTCKMKRTGGSAEPYVTASMGNWPRRHGPPGCQIGEGPHSLLRRAWLSSVLALLIHVAHCVAHEATMLCVSLCRRIVELLTCDAAAFCGSTLTRPKKQTSGVPIQNMAFAAVKLYGWMSGAYCGRGCGRGLERKSLAQWTARSRGPPPVLVPVVVVVPR